MDIPSNAVIMSTEPIPNISPDQWLQIHNNCENDSDLADALAGAWNESGWLMHLVDEDSCNIELEQKFNGWWDLQVFLINKIKSLEPQGISSEKLPFIEILTPFMNRHGYTNGGGWWIRDLN